MKKAMAGLFRHGTKTTNLVEEVKTLRRKIDLLLAQKCDIQTSVEHEEIQPGKKRKRDVEWWFERVDEKERKLLGIEAQLEKQGPCSELINQVANEIKEVEELIRQGKFPGKVVLDDHPSSRLALVQTSLVGSRSAENIEMILNWLKEDGVFAIGVHGMGGVGKTTLQRTIHNKLLQDCDIKGQVYWVTASRDCSLLKLQTAIGKCLGLDNIGEEDGERRKSLIFHRLCQLQKSVLIIDDMWSHYSIDKIGIPLESCKIVITTRSPEVCQKVGCQRVIRVVPLSKEDAWALFVEKCGVVLNNLTVIATEIVQQCAGLPLALVAMGSCLSGVTDVHQWENALYELKKPTRRQDNDMDDEVFRILQFSYDSLIDERTKQCFLSCVLFPEDWDINRDKLIELWITEGLLDDIEGWENKVNKGHTITNRLESSSLFESTTSNWGNKRCLIMHDLIRDMAMILAQHGTLCMAKAGLQLKKVPEHKQWTRDLVKVSLRHNDIEEIPCGMSPETPKLRVLILSLNPLKEIPESFFVHMKALQVLDLSETFIKRLPDTVSDLENLKGLFLQKCCELRRVPSLAKLTKLMALDLPTTMCLEGGVEGLERWKCMEKLYHYCVPCSVLDVPRFNNLMLSGQLKLYRIFLCNSCSTPKTYYDQREYQMLLGTRHKKELIIHGLGEITQVSLPSTIQSLAIKKSSTEGPRSLEAALPSLRNATDLRNLVIKEWEELEYIFISSASPEDSSNHPLQSLHLQGLANLRRIAKKVVYPSFSILKTLYIGWCPKIRVLFPSTRTQQHQIILPSLESIRVFDCDELEEIIESNKESPSLETTIHVIRATLPNLRQLILKKLPQLGSIYSMQLHLCPSLEDIEMEYCPGIEGIFSDTVSEDESIRMNLENTSGVGPSVALPKLSRLRLKHLLNLRSILPLQLDLCTSLKEIIIEDCPVLESICEEVQEEFEPNRESLSCKTVDHRVNVTHLNPIVPLPNLRVLRLSRLPKLGSSIYQLQLHLATSLEELEIRDCPKIEGVLRDAIDDPRLVLGLPSLNKLWLSGFHEVRSLYLPSSLETITLRNCPRIEGVFTYPRSDAGLVSELPSLRHLELSGLPELRSIYPIRLHLSTSLERLSIKECPKLEGIFTNPTGVIKPILALPKLYALALEGLPKLSSIYSMQIHLCTSLEDIEIEECPKIEGIFSKDGINMNLENTCDVFSSVDLPKLNFLCLRRLSNLGSILPLQLHLCPSLMSISIEACPKLESICEEVQEKFEGSRGASSSKTVDRRVNFTKFSPIGPLPNLRHLYLSDLPKLGTIHPLQLYLTTSLEKLEIRDCPKIEGIFRDAIVDTELVVDLSSLKELRLSGFPEVRSLYLPTSLRSITLRNCPQIEGVFTCPRSDVELVSELAYLCHLELSGLPELRTIYPMRLNLSTSLQTLEIKGCPKLEGIFTDPTGVISPILALPQLYRLVLEGLPSMSSVYRGLLICPDLGVYRTINECPQLKMLSLSSRLICDASSSTLASFPTQSEDPVWWEPLHRDYPDDVILLTDHIHQAWQLSTMPEK